MEKKKKRCIQLNLCQFYLLAVFAWVKHDPLICNFFKFTYVWLLKLPPPVSHACMKYSQLAECRSLFSFLLRAQGQGFTGSYSEVAYVCTHNSKGVRNTFVKSHLQGTIVSLFWKIVNLRHIHLYITAVEQTIKNSESTNLINTIVLLIGCRRNYNTQPRNRPSESTNLINTIASSWLHLLTGCRHSYNTQLRNRPSESANLINTQFYSKQLVALNQWPQKYK